MIEKKETSLLLASLGSYQRNVFRSTEDALKARDFIVEPDEKDKAIIHCLIYDYLKPGRDVAPVYAVVKGLLDKYGLTSFIAGCTEFHLLSRYIHENALPGISFVDPLFLIARQMDCIL